MRPGAQISRTGARAQPGARMGGLDGFYAMQQAKSAGVGVGEDSAWTDPLRGLPGINSSLDAGIVDQQTQGGRSYWGAERMAERAMRDERRSLQQQRANGGRSGGGRGHSYGGGAEGLPRVGQQGPQTLIAGNTQQGLLQKLGPNFVNRLYTPYERMGMGGASGTLETELNRRPEIQQWVQGQTSPGVLPVFNDQPLRFGQQTGLPGSVQRALYQPSPRY